MESVADYISFGGSMNSVVEQMLQKYDIKNKTDAENALKEVIQEITLLGLSRSNFFEKAAFYGGTSLRILYGLPRFSEDLDFTLFKPDPEFSLKPYLVAVQKELFAFGFETEVASVDKSIESTVDSAFVKANTKIHLLKIQSLNQFSSQIQSNAKLQVKFEIDTDCVAEFETEPRYLLQPTSFAVISLKLPDLFAGKLHALLYRKWKGRIKGRDFYDFVWYMKQRTPVRLKYLRQKALQSGHIQIGELETLEDLKKTLIQRFKALYIEQIKKDVYPFIKDQKELDIWSTDFFTQITEAIQLA